MIINNNVFNMYINVYYYYTTVTRYDASVTRNRSRGGEGLNNLM